MSNFSIAISGVNAAQKGLEVVGNNMANAATEGYHKQKLVLLPAYASQYGQTLIGGGVEVCASKRLVDTLLEAELNRQNSSLNQTSQELTTLQTVENIFGEFLSDDLGLGTSIDELFNSFYDLSAAPQSSTWQNQTVSMAQSMVGQFNTIGSFLSDLDAQLRLEVDSVIDSANILIKQIATLNASVQRLQATGGEANNLVDSRDQCIAELSKLTGIDLQNKEYGMTDVNIASIPAVIGTSYSTITTGYDSDGNYGFAMQDGLDYITSISGGKLGALLNLKNEMLPDINSDLDSLASSLIDKINEIHVQGCGSAGAFSSLTGQPIQDTDISSMSSVVDGSFYIRVNNSSTGEITRYKIDVDADTDSLETIAAKISDISGLNSSVVDSKLTIVAENGYEFDFTPAVLSSPATSDFNGTAEPKVTVGGVYTGDVNDTLTFTVVGTGQIGNGNLELQVTNGSGQVIKNLNIGSGYAAGDAIDVGNGLTVKLSVGDLAEGDSFTVSAWADTDTSGLLAAAGMNTFFTGSTAEDIALNQDIADSPSRIATALGSDFSDNLNITKLANLSQSQMSGLNSLTFAQYYSKIVTEIGQEISTRQNLQANSEHMIHNLTSQQSELSGVDINEEAAQMLVYEQMFQAMSKYLNTTQELLVTMMNIL